jgi:hypothetical protein
MLGQVQWELIQPLDDESVYALPFREGRGVHHIAVATPSFDDAVAAQSAKGNGLVLSGEFSGVITEIFSGTPGADVTPHATSP